MTKLEGCSVFEIELLANNQEFMGRVLNAPPFGLYSYIFAVMVNMVAAIVGERTLYECQP